MKDATLSRTIWAVSVPLIFAGLSETILHVTDTFLLARVGIVEVGAVALADAILQICIVPTLGLVDGMQILIARRAGERRDRAVGQVFNQGLCVLGLASIGLTAALLIAAPYLSAWMVTSAAVGAAVNDFLGIIAYGIFFNAANFAYSALLVGLARTRALIWATVVLGVVNLALDCVLIFGAFGLPALGIRGAALGSLGAEIATFVFLTVYVLRCLDLRRYELFRLARWNGKLARALVRISSPVALQALLEALRWFLFFVIVEWVGEAALALSNLVYACYAVFRIPTEGFAEAACSLVSKLIGQGESRRIGQLMREVTAPAYLVTLPLLVPAFVFPRLVLSLFTSDPALLDAGAAILRMVSLAMLVVIPAEMWFVAVTGTGDTDAALVIETVLTAIMLACGYAAAFVLRADLQYIWMSIPITWLACLVLSYAWIRGGYWKRVQI